MVLLFLVFTAFSVHPAEGVDLVLVAPDSQTPRRGVAEVTLQAKDGTEGAVLPIDITVPGTLELPRPDGVGARLRFVVDGLWAMETTLPPASVAAQPETVIFLPTTSIYGRLTVPHGFHLPQTVKLEAMPMDSALVSTSQLPPRIMTACPVDGSARFFCTIPTGMYDMEISTPGFAHLYFWNHFAAESSGQNLGILELRPGASLVGRAVEPVGRPASASKVPIEVILRPVSAARHPGRIEEMKTETRLADPRGFFQFEGLPAGRYRIQARAGGSLESQATDVTLEEGLESELLHEIELYPHAKLTLALDPPHDPYQAPWAIQIFGERTTANVQGTPDARGLFHAILPSGSYRVEVATHRGDRWMQEIIELPPGAMEVRLEPSLLALRGQITRDGEPISGHLWFGGRHGSPRSHAYANQAGEFRAKLPHAGEWKVDLQEGGEDTTIPLGPVWIEKPEDDSTAELHLEVPNLAITGTVIDPAGAPQAGIRVRTSGPRGTLSTKTREDGTFRFQGLADGTYFLSAGRHTEASTTRSVALSAEDPVADLQLQLHPQRELHGQILSVAGPIPRVSLSIYPNLPPGIPLMYGPVTRETGFSGEFRFTVPEQASEVGLLVQAPGFAARMVSVSVEDTAHLPPLILDVEQPSGILVLHVPRDERWKTELIHQGARIPVGEFERWATLHRIADHPDLFRIPAMETGYYALCWRASQPRACVEGFLPLYGELILDPALPNPQTAP